MRTSKNIKIDVVTVPFSGHLYPLLELMTPFLNDKNYCIRFISGVKKKESIEKKGFDFIPLFPERPTVMEEIANTEAKIGLKQMYQQLNQNASLLPEAVQQIEQAVRENKTDLVIADFISVPVGIVCKKLSIPWITTIPTPFALEAKDGTPSYLGGWRMKPNRIYQLRDYLGRIVIHQIKKTLFFLIRRQLAHFDFSLYNEKKEEAIYSPYSIVGLGMKELEFDRTFPKQFKWLGPCCQSAELVTLDWLTQQAFAKKIFVTLGTHLGWGKKAMQHRIKEIACQFPTILFVVSLGDSQKIDEFQQIQNNVYQFGYVPYSTHIACFDYVIHHGGAGILYNCIKHNKPALILPHDYDQFDYAVRAERAGIALTTKKKSTKVIVKKLTELMQKKEWNMLEEIHQQFYKYEPAKEMRREIERVLKKVKK